MTISERRFTFLVALTSSYRPSLNSSFIACFKPLNPLHTTVSFSSKTDRISPPFVLILLESRYPKKLLDGLLRVIVLDLLRIVVLVLNPNIPALIVVVVLVLKVIPEAVSKETRKAERSDLLLLVGLLHKVIVVGHCGGVRGCFEENPTSKWRE